MGNELYPMTFYPLLNTLKGTDNSKKSLLNIFTMKHAFIGRLGT